VILDSELMVQTPLEFVVAAAVSAAARKYFPSGLPLPSELSLLPFL
jgi:hypothetical protein